MRYFVLAILASITISAVGFGYFCLSSPGLVNNEVVFEISPGEPFVKVAKRLKKSEIINNTFLFRVLGRLSRKTTKVRTGEYLLNKGMLPMQILDVLTSGKSIAYSITFPEGLNLYEMSELVEKKGLASKKEFLKWTSDRKFIKSLLNESLPSLEGYLYPETYTYTKYDGAKQIIQQMVKSFVKMYNSISHFNGGQFSRHQWVTLASIIEKETGFQGERKLVASVFHNRLKKNMRLQTDPTVLYGILDQTGKMKKNITKKHLLTKNRYNTYTFRGLPYGPISNPGKDSMLVAIQPTKTNYLYFVSRNDGTSQFSATLKDHNRAVRKYQMNRSARKGKSWRDIHKKKK